MKWTLEKRRVSELREYAKNPRRLNKHDAEHLQKSIDKFGQCEPIVINSDNTIIGGHQRLRTLHKLKYKEVDVYVPDTPLSPKEVEELNIRLNRNAGEWDDDMLANAWDIGDLLDWGFTDAELAIDSSDQESESKDESDECHVKTKNSDEYKLGPHTLISLDMKDINAVMEILSSQFPLTLVALPKHCDLIVNAWIQKFPGTVVKNGEHLGGSDE